MYIEFKIATPTANQIINNALHKWSDHYQIPYNTKIVKDFKRIIFDKDEHYSLFAMTWNLERRYYALSKWRIVSDLNNKSSFEDAV